MSLPRNKQLDFNDNQQNTIEPTNSLSFVGFGPMECEEQTAAIINKTRNCMSKEDVGGVAYRFLQSRQAQNTTFQQAAAFSIAMLVALKELLSLDTTIEDNNTKVVLSILFSMATLFCLANILPNVCNTSRFKKNTNDCEEWLSNRINQNTLTEIKNVSYPRFLNGSLSQLVKILNKANIDSESVQTQLESRRIKGKML